MTQHLVCRSVSWLSIPVILLLPILFLAYRALWYRQGFEGIFPPGPLTAAHAGVDCKQCHVEPWRGWQRVLGAERHPGLAMDRACAQCHAGLLDQPRPRRLPAGGYGIVVPPPLVAAHHVRQLPAEVDRCADCHREHQPERGLLAVPQERCQRCHQDLHTADQQHTVYPHITEFVADHPPFGARREGGMQDPAALHFNHELHLQLGGRGAPGTAPRGQPLVCQSCHEPEAGGRRMAPVRYQEHCADCHPLAVGLVAETQDSSLQEAIRAFRRRPAPHATAEVVSAVLRERFRLLAEEYPALWQEKRTGQLLRDLPGRSARGQASQDLSTWVETQAARARRLLLEAPGGCRYCHVPARGPKPRFAPAEFEKTNVPASWFPLAKFSHARHGLMACSDCHGQVRTSRRTGDLSLPTKEKCAECHHPTAHTPTRARSDCLECHEYHPR